MRSTCQQGHTHSGEATLLPTTGDPALHPRGQENAARGSQIWENQNTPCLSNDTLLISLLSLLDLNSVLSWGINEATNMYIDDYLYQHRLVLWLTNVMANLYNIQEAEVISVPFGRLFNKHCYISNKGEQSLLIILHHLTNAKPWPRFTEK